MAPRASRSLTSSTPPSRDAMCSAEVPVFGCYFKREEGVLLHSALLHAICSAGKYSIVLHVIVTRDIVVLRCSYKLNVYSKIT